MRQSVFPKHLASLVLLGLLAGCTLPGPRPGGGEVVTEPPGSTSGSGPIITPPPPPNRMPAHPRFAPPPGGNSYWDTQLSVYVLPDQTYYRDRTYYRWNNGWTWASHPSGPWQAADITEIPPGLSRKYAQ